MYKEESRIDRISIIAKASAIGLALLVASCQSIPDGETGSPADALASKMLAAANLETWNTRVQGVEFRFREKQNRF